MSAREEILARLRTALSAGRPFPAADTAARPQPVTRISTIVQPLSAASATAAAQTEALIERFCSELERVRGVPHRAASHAEASQQLLALMTERMAKRALVWEGLPAAYYSALHSAGVSAVPGGKLAAAEAHVGITSVSCAIAATGTLVLQAGPGRPRAASLLPPLHVAIVEVAQLLPRLEDYLAVQRRENLQALRESSNIVLITGASRTADIEMNVVYGVHGPLELHVLIVG